MPEWTREMWQDFWKAPFHVAFWNSWAWIGGKLWAWVGVAVIAWIATVHVNATWKYTLDGVLYTLFGLIVIAVAEKLVAHSRASRTASEATAARPSYHSVSREDEPISLPTPQVTPEKPPVEIPAQLIPEGSMLNALSGLPASDPEAEKAAETLIAGGASPDAMGLFSREQFKRFNRIYRLDKPTNLLTLKPQIDTRSREADALLLIVYGYKMLKGRSELSVATANRSLCDSGYTRNLSAMQIATMMFDQNLDADAVAREYVAVGYLRKHGLARGGVFSLTDEGISRAEALISDIYPRLD
jgi:hypothetical protein